MTRRTILITGASDGIGAAAARQLTRSGAKVVVVGRSQAKTTAVAQELGADYYVADFADLTQVRALADKIRSEYSRIDVLANNAGGMCRELEMTADGLEKTYQVNYLAPFLLTTQLLDMLVDSRATVVNTTSSSQRLLPKVTISDLEHTAQRRPASPTRSPNSQSCCSPRNYTGAITTAGCRRPPSIPAMSTPTSARPRDRGSCDS